MTEPLVKVRNLTKIFGGETSFLRSQTTLIKAIDDVSFDIYPGETLGLVGESGSGKSSLGLSLVRLIEVSKGQVFFEGNDIASLGRSAMRALRRHMQLVFQDPLESLNPKHSIATILSEPYVIHERLNAVERIKRCIALLERVGLNEQALRRYPHELSGGQRQRIGIARAIALKPKFVVCDEPLSSLDLSTGAQIINLLLDLQNDLGLSYLFISHDLAAVSHLSDRIAVMFQGQLVELGPADDLIKQPKHPYTRLLWSAGFRRDLPALREQREKPAPELELKQVGGSENLTLCESACKFYHRCPYAEARCKAVPPPLTEGQHRVRCHVFT